jgi:hypothetical protein
VDRLGLMNLILWIVSLWHPAVLQWCVAGSLNFCLFVDEVQCTMFPLNESELRSFGNNK